MKKCIQRIILITLSILLNQSESAAQINEEVKYCQIAAAYTYNNDLYATGFTFGKQYEKTADSLFAVCKTKYAFKDKNVLYLTDALNYFNSLGWKLVTTFPVTASSLDLNRYYYVLKRE